MAMNLECLVIIFCVPILASCWSQLNGAKNLTTFLENFLNGIANYSDWVYAQEDDEIRQMQLLEMEQYMDTKMDMCNEVYRFACGNFDSVVSEAGVPPDFEYSVPELDRYMVNYLIQQELSVPANEHDSESEVKAKVLYKSCMRDDPEDLVFQLQEALHWLNLWPILEPVPSYDKYDWIDLAAITAIFNISTVFDVTSPTSLIRFSASKMPPYWDSVFYSHQAYGSYVASVLDILLDNQHLEWYKPLPSELYRFELELAKILDHPLCQHSKESIKNGSLYYFVQSSPDLQFRRFLTMYGGRFAPLSLAIEVESETCLSAVAGHFSSSERESIRQFFFWRVARELIERLNVTNDEVSTRSEECVLYVRDRMPTALASLLGRVYYPRLLNKILEKTAEKVADLIFSGSEPSQAVIFSDVWNKVYLKMETRPYEIGYPDFIQNTTEVDEEYKNCTIQPDKFVFNQLYLAYCKNSRDLNHKFSELEYDPFELELDGSGDKIYITLGKIMNKYSDSSFDFVSFARIGSAFAEALLEKFLSEVNRSFSQLGKEFTLNDFLGSHCCSSFDPHEVVKAYALMAARSAFLESSKEANDPVLVEEMEIGADQAFSIAYLQQFCATSNVRPIPVSDIILTATKHHLQCYEKSEYKSTMKECFECLSGRSLIDD